MEPGTVGILVAVIVVLCILFALVLFLCLLRRRTARNNKLKLTKRDIENGHTNDLFPANIRIRSGRVRQPICSIVVCQKIHSVYGENARYSQLYELAQKYTGDEKIKSRVAHVQSLEEINLKFSDPSNQIEFENQKRKTILQEMPGLSPPNEKCVFVQQEIDQNGGRLAIGDVVLTIPPGAVNQKVQFSIAIVWDDNFYPKLPKKQSRLSPVVLCQPSMHFGQPVKLALPHCAKMIENWAFKVLSCDENSPGGGSWEEWTADESCKINISESNVTIDVHHFTLYTFVGESKAGQVAAKAVQLVAFVPSLVPGSSFETKIYCINDYGKDIKEVRETEKEIKRRQADGPLPIFIHDNGGNLVVTLSKSPQEWTLLGDKLEELDFESIWHALSPSCKFIYKPMKDDVREIHCEYESYQLSHSSRKLKLKITEELQKLIPSVLNNAKDPLVNLRRQLILLLDPQTANIAGETGNWKDLAAILGLTNDKIRWIGEQRQSPTEILLNLYEENGNGLQKLKDYLIEINRPDAASEVDKLLLSLSVDNQSV